MTGATYRKDIHKYVYYVSTYTGEGYYGPYVSDKTIKNDPTIRKFKLVEITDEKEKQK